MPCDNFPHVAGGDINPCRFVTLSPSADFTLLEANANEAIIGVSHESAQDAPLPGASTLAAASGDHLAIYPIGSVCRLEAGSGGWTRGSELISDSNGKGVARATTGTTIQNVGAIALESVSEGELGKVLIVRYPLRPALA